MINFLLRGLQEATKQFASFSRIEHLSPSKYCMPEGNLKLEIHLPNGKGKHSTSFDILNSFIDDFYM